MTPRAAPAAPSLRDVQQQLAEAEATIQALLSGQIDAAVDVTSGTPVLLAKAQQALRDSEERHREQAALLDIAHEAIMVKDLDGRILYWNKGAEKTFGWSAAEALGRKAEGFLHTDAAAFHNARQTLLAAGVWTGEQTRRTKAGHVVVVESGWTLVRDREGRPKSILAIHTDITERRTLEEQFLQAQKMEAIGRLAGGVAHDFNNLLTVILGYCELLLAVPDSDDRRQADIGEIQKAGTRAAGLTRQLLAFSRKQIIELARLDLNIVIADMQVMLGRLIGDDVEVRLDLKPKLSCILADRGQIEQIVLNLAVNARDAMSKGGMLTIATDNAVLAAGPHVSLTVSDTGTGMSPEVQAHLFEPFFTTKEAGKGTGLGLATVHGIVTRSGGHVKVHSEVGQGTSFTAYFPKTEAEEKPADVPAPVARPTGTVTVLVVDDADAVRVLAARMLKKQGYTTLVAANAEEALRVFDENLSIDVLLTDVVMPGSSGPELTTELTRRRPALKVVYMSGYTDEAIVHHGVLEAGIIFLHKPFTAIALGGKIREALERRPEA